MPSCIVPIHLASVKPNKIAHPILLCSFMKFYLEQRQEKHKSKIIVWYDKQLPLSKEPFQKKSNIVIEYNISFIYNVSNSTINKFHLKHQYQI